MNRFIPVVIGLLVAVSVFPSDKFNGDHEQFSMATTGRIVRINAKTRTMTIRSSDAAPSAPAANVPLLKLPRIVFPGGIAITLPTSFSKPAAGCLNEYTLVTTDETVFQDGADPIRFDDFETGETVSIHGVLNGAVLTASRLAKWS
jgi:hypothetical protein